jgi:hypothetical protein
MDARLERVIRQLTFTLLVGSVPPIAAGAAGMAPSLPLVAALVATTGVAAWAWEAADRPEGLVAVPLGSLVATGVAVVGLAIAASAGELQSLGGLTGLAGVANYLLRPFYRLVYTGVAELDRVRRQRRRQQQ